MDLLCLMQYFSNRLLMSLFTNRVPLSLINLLGLSNPVIMCLRMELEIAAPVAFFKGKASTHFVKCSIATKIHVWPLEGGLIGPIKSSP